MKTDIFNHRLERCDTESVNALTLADSVGMMTGLAMSVLAVLGEDFERENNRLTRDIILFSFDSVEKEIMDLKNLVFHYHDMVSGRVESKQEELENE